MKREYLVLILVAISLLTLIYLFQGDFLILGGEGNYFLDINSVKNLYGYTWLPYGGTGVVNPFLHFSAGIFNFFSILQNIGLSVGTINIISVFLVFFLPFISIYWLLKIVLKIDFKISILISLFYILNPFSTYHLGGLMFWNTAPMFVLPIVFGIIYKYFFDFKKLFVYFGIFTALVSFSLANVPYLVILHIFLLISLIIISYLHKNKFETKRILLNFGILELGFTLFNLWWLISLIRFSVFDSVTSGLKESGVSWAKHAAMGDGLIMNKLFTLRTLISFKVSDYSFLTQCYNNNLIKIISFIPFIIIIISLLFKKVKSEKRNIAILVILLFLLGVLFLNKGVNEPFSNVYVFLLEKIPLFYIFRSPLEKFSIPSVFLISLVLAFILRVQKRLIYYFLLGIYLITCSVPYITLNFIPDIKINAEQDGSRKYVDLPEFKKFRDDMKNKKLDYRLLSLPNGGIYQVMMHMYDNKYYTGMDPLLMNIPQSFIADYSGVKFKNLFLLLDSEIHERLLSLYSIRNIHLNKKLFPWYGNLVNKSIPEQEQILNTKYQIKGKYGEMILYNNQFFLPHFYTPQDIITSNQAVESLPQIVSQPDYKIRSAIYFEEQNKDRFKQIQGFFGEIKKLPIIEFKRVNPTEYRVIVHQAKGSFPLVFSESFHQGWKVYLTKSEIKNQESKIDVSEYKILEGNEEEEASREELAEFIEKGWVSNLGDGKEREIKHKKYLENGKEVVDHIEKYKIDFVSKNFQGTIQNDNLLGGYIWDTWFQKALPEENHLMANGYANSWWVDLNQACNSGKVQNCIKNPDGSYDFELIVEFWPQRLFYFGIGISGAALLFCLFYLAWDYKRNRKLTL